MCDLEKGRKLGTLKDHGPMVVDVAATVDGRRAVSASRDNA